MNVHFIAVGGSAMHNIAIAMHKKKFIVTLTKKIKNCINGIYVA